MNPIFVPALAAWCVLAAAVLGLAIFRRVVSSHEDDFLHVRETDTAVVAEQTAVARKLDVIDKWGKSLTAFTLVAGIALASYYVYMSWHLNNAASANVQILR
jgi:hypothetical protein